MANSAQVLPYWTQVPPSCNMVPGHQHIQNNIKLLLRVADNLTVRTLTPLPQVGLCHACLQSHLFRRKARDQRSTPLKCLIMVNSVNWALKDILPAYLCSSLRCGGVGRVVRDVLQYVTLCSAAAMLTNLKGMLIAFDMPSVKLDN